MTRVIGGSAGGRRLRTPKGDATRPTSDRVREALFSAVQSWCGSLAGLRVLDLYAGSGAVGLEAWSRGALAVTCVEGDRRTAALAAANADALGASAAVRVVARKVAPTLEEGPGGDPVDLVYLDPPYPLGEEALAADLAALAGRGWLAPDAMVVVERSARGPEPGWPDGLRPERDRRYGETRLWFALWYGPGTAADTAEEE